MFPTPTTASAGYAFRNISKMGINNTGEKLEVRRCHMCAKTSISRLGSTWSNVLGSFRNVGHKTGPFGLLRHKSYSSYCQKTNI